MSISTYKHNLPFTCENGEIIGELEIAYETWGRLNSQGDNVVWVIHALTANSDVFDWWGGLFGENKLFDPQDQFIVCANVLGSHYGTTCPLSANPETGEPYFLSFPNFSIRDMARAQIILADHLGIKEIAILIGGSLGGQQAVEWAIQEPSRIKDLILMATNARHSAWGIAFNESQRLAISADPTFYTNSPEGGKNGLKVARSIALLSYRNYETYVSTQQEVSDEKREGFKACSYQNYQGEKLVKRFNAYSYWYLTKAMDSHNVARGRGSAKDALKAITANTLVIGITSDQLFPISEQKYLAENIEGAFYSEINSFYGHDGFLIETDALTNVIAEFRQKVQPEYEILNINF
ncbi:homoserine O-acetyltransferase family protein [Desertivirga brevis]|uniref:homoserine O-acetyltransferase family protein n=1 Tax=Desertivirga brevis TaxID=2810310 RepID=UPI001A96EBF2|nr:homoserine O-acetyltransferase [Pedobacter sp. SYSU D00873]